MRWGSLSWPLSVGISVQIPGSFLQTEGSDGGTSGFVKRERHYRVGESRWWVGLGGSGSGCGSGIQPLCLIQALVPGSCKLFSVQICAVDFREADPS